MKKDKVYTRRIGNNVRDILALDSRCYCELGPGRDGLVSLALKKAGREVVAVEAPWAQDANKDWAEPNGVRLYLQDLFTGDLSVIEEKVDCFILAHCIAHFRFSPYILFRKLHALLPSGGHFYLSTVNGTSYHRVAAFAKGRPVVEKVSPEVHAGYRTISGAWNRTDMPQIWDDWMHVKEYTRREIEELFTRSGFEVVISKHVNNNPGWTRANWKQQVAVGFFPHLADEIVVVGRKP